MIFREGGLADSQLFRK